MDTDPASCDHSATGGRCDVCGTRRPVACRFCFAEIVYLDDQWLHLFTLMQQCHDGAPEVACP